MMRQSLALAGLLLLAGCGQKGALYLPDSPPQAVPAATVPAPSTTQPADPKKKPASAPQG